MKTLVNIFVPSILPYFLSGARLAFGWRVSLVAEILGASSGVGYRLRQASDLIQTDQVFAWTIAQIAMMLVIEIGMLQPLEQYLFCWQRDVRA
jgi:NitT/TauT family transport system permease protein